MIAMPYTDRVTSHKGVIGFGDPKHHCDASRRTPQFLRLNYSSFQVLVARMGELALCRFHASGARFANPFEPPPSFGDECSGFSKPHHLEATMAISVCTRTSAQNPTTPAPLNRVQLVIVLDRIAGFTATLNNLLTLAQTNEDEWETSNLMDAAQAIAVQIGGMADSAIGGQVIGNRDRWDYGPNFRDLGKAGAA